MAILKCKMCGGNLTLIEGATVVECEYCGTKQTVPSADNEKKMTLFARAERLRSSCEFDKAAGIYESIIADFPEEAEAYWGLLLCKYGIEYVDDPATGKKIPTCHRSSFDSIMEDEDFEQVMENADSIARKVYREEAKAIEEIRKGILEVSSQEEPYDIFICYKETDENGERTIDSVIAQDIYDNLTEKGYRVFFARITLEDKLGTAYEPYIFAALNSAKVMLVIGTDYDYFNAVWVKNEWSRFLSLIAKGEKKTLIPCYKDIDAYDIPKEFKHLQAQDMGKVGAMQDLLRGISKIILRTNNTVNTGDVRNEGLNAQASNVVKLGMVDLELSKYDSAKSLFRDALKMDSNCAEAYFGLALISEINNEENDISLENEAKQYTDRLYSLSPVITDYEKETLKYAFNYCLILYIKYYNKNRLKYIINSNKEKSLNCIPNAYDIAIKTENVNAVELLLELNLDSETTRSERENESEIFKKINSYKIPIVKAIIEANNYQMVKAFLKNGSDVNRIFWKDKQELSLLSAAVYYSKNPKLVNLLIESGADVSIQRKSESSSFSILYDAITIDNYEIFDMLIKAGVDITDKSVKHSNKGNIAYITPLSVAIHRKSYEIIQRLLSVGADIEDIRRIELPFGKVDEYSPLSDAINIVKNEEIIKLLINNGANVNRIERIHFKSGGYDERPLLSSAIINTKNVAIVKLLLQSGASPNEKSVSVFGNNLKSEKTPLVHAIMSAKNLDIVNCLIKNGADVNYIYKEPVENGNSLEAPLLFLAIAVAKDFGLAKSLSDAGADWNAVASFKGIKKKIKKFPFEKIGVDKKTINMLNAIGYKRTV